ncbi:MAG: hypothetical protein ACJ72V_10365, partial [Nitrososphaeraceae archaeon]
MPQSNILLNHTKYALLKAAQALVYTRWKFFFLEGKAGFVSSVKTASLVMVFCYNNRSHNNNQNDN